MTKEIQLTKGYVALVDDEDFERLSKYKWHYCNRYAARHSYSLLGKRKMVYMHRVVMPTPDGMNVDHVNLDRLDNRRCNLRLCTCAENGRNRGMDRDNTSGFKGVCKSGEKWRAGIRFDGITKYLGTFENPVLAARAYDKAAKECFGKFANTNF